MCENQLLTSQGHKNVHSSMEGYIGGRRTDGKVAGLDCTARG
jgi:hypothetical protein